MLGEIKLNELNYFVERLSREELVWLNGYVSGLIKNSLQAEFKPAGLAGKLTITFGTETGNSKKLAADFATKARALGLTVKLNSLDQYRFSDLVKEKNFIAVISTHGEGEPPAAAKKFFNHICENKIELSNLKYAVLALGDSAYPFFCKAGETLDEQLSLLGGERISALQKCDVDFENDANDWFNQLVKSISGKEPPLIKHTKSLKQVTRKIYAGRILRNINLNGKGSSKETHHIEISADDLNYQPGDALGIIPKNKKEEVDAIVKLLNVEVDKPVSYKNEQFSLAQLLTNNLSISYLPERIVSAYAAIVHQNIPSVRMDFIDLLKIYPPQNENQIETILQTLEPMSPRLYSISSSLGAHDGEVHLTVARDCFQVNSNTRYGLCSDYLSKASIDSSVEFYIHRNSQFRLPAPEKDIILIGPGTGIAPYRAFIEERVNAGAQGKSWLFFGDQHFESDFLYQTEWQDYIKTGGLTKMNVAFSRDQNEKIYVQHKMVQQSAELFQWIKGGAYVYVCGAKEPMSFDVEKALIEIIRNHGNKSDQQAREYVGQLIEQGRYLKDVY